MKSNESVINEMERLLKEYENEVEGKRTRGVLTDKTARTYLYHPNNFLRWCKGEFVPGQRNKR